MKAIEISHGHPKVTNVRRFIKAAYALNYGARITNIPKTIVALLDDKNKVHVAAGLRDYSEKFFSEYYLDAPVEFVIGSAAQKLVDRSTIVEVSCLASRTPSVSVSFMRELVLYGEQLGFDWAFFTVTRRLENVLRRMRLPLITLAEASGSRVPNPEAWGSYYETEPRVVAFGRDQLMPFLMKQRAHAPACEVQAHG
jgi:Thermostable hemolysin